MRREPHPLTGTMYEDLGDGKVKVQKEGSNSYGVFTWKGEWVEGEVTQADPLMLLYIGGPDLPRDHEVIWMGAPAKTFDGTIPMEHFPGTHMDEMPRIVGAYRPDTGMETEEGWRSNGNVDYRYFLDNDRVPERVPDAYRMRGSIPGGPKRIKTDRYWKQEYHDLEVEKLWKKTWQMACREDEIPNVGDYHVYTIAHLSYLVVRTEDGIRAHQNVCLHRGRMLKDCSGRGESVFRCPFHGWSWNLDGSLKEITTEWDFPGVREDVKQLPAVSVQTWEGFVFINPDPEAGPLEDFLGPIMMEHYKGYGFEHRYIQANVSKLIKANWKLTMEAFMEAYHLIATHPHQILIGGDGANTHYDVFGNWGRAGASPSPGSPQRGMFRTPEEAIDDYRASADATRALIEGLTGEDLSGWSDAQLHNSGFNDLFPNLHPWGGWMRIVFRFRPHGDNPDESIMDILLLAPWPKDKPRPAPARHRKLGFDEPFVMAPELLSLSKIADQDVFNVPAQHRGLKAKDPPFIWFGKYQDGKIRNFHENYDRALGLSSEMPGNGAKRRR
jgi:phenylpropionate dioxygenase-like ring-hydroxylating dioxygenase large terminal subunit